ncbi:MAG: UBP-type zinc finger domain-containing protein [Actinobacteria bacterium]|nr:UBP-type zinc finger domain-containing protein [Actinomycetota bacterium]MCI0544641.1 UBP-type zinc finger domain-containing protein [Actinomycetota bacterium]MCI0679395.1 UBP-type zinc finger domain-containing protein [Actinomycetota bacterium]
MTRSCYHSRRLEVEAAPQAEVCEQCVATGDRWVHLRACLVCGVVGCCDNSKNRHARKHWELVGHPLVQSIEPGESWRYCFPDRQMIG